MGQPRKPFAPSPLHDPALRDAFVDRLQQTRSYLRAAEQLGVSRRAVFKMRQTYPDFDEQCTNLVSQRTTRIGPRRRAEFLETLAATGDPAVAADAILTPVRAMFRLRTKDAAFAAAWDEAMAEAVERLEAKAIASALAGGAASKDVAAGAVIVLRALGRARRTAPRRESRESPMRSAMATREALLARIAALTAPKGEA